MPNENLKYLQSFTSENLVYLCDRSELYAIAQELNIPNRSQMKKADLAAAINNHVKGEVSGV